MQKEHADESSDAGEGTAGSPHSHHGSPDLRRTIGKWQLLLYGLGSMLGAGIYTLIDDAASLMGSAVWAAFATAMVAALLTGLSYASLGSRYPRAGGAAYVTQHAFRLPIISYVIGLAVLMSGLTSMATGTQAIAENAIKGFLLYGPGKDDKLVVEVAPTTTEAAADEKQATDKAKDSSWIKPIAIAIVLMIGAVLIKGIRESMIANVICTIVEAAGLIFIIIVGIRYWGSVNYFELPDAPVANNSGLVLLLLNGAILTFFSFIGFEDILNVSEEVKDPARTVPFGLVGAMIVATIIYMAGAITAVSVIPHAKLAASSTPLMDVAHTAAPWFTGIDVIYIIITIFAVANTALLNYLMGSRLLYGMSRQGLLPGVLGTVHAHTRTPIVAIATLFVIVAVLILSGGVRPMAEATVLLLLSVFVVMNAGLVRLKMRPGEPKGAFEVPIFVPVLGALVCLTLIVYRIWPVENPSPERTKAPLIAATIIVAAVVLYVIIAPKQIAEEGVIERDD